MPSNPLQVQKLQTMFETCSPCISALGDETRQAILLTLVNAGCTGMRVGDIAKGTHLSQPAVSHHLKILCDAGVLTVRKERTMNFYRINPNPDTLRTMVLLFGNLLKLIDEQNASSSNQ